MRDRHEASIRRLNSTFGREFDNALSRVIGGRLDFFTDDQIAKIRAEMVRKEADDRQFRRRQRAAIMRMRAFADAP
jgi:hypothetical protein